MRQVLLVLWAGLGGLGLVLAWGASGSLAAVLIGTNTASLLLYGWDKLSARAGSVRVPEWALHLVSLAGGAGAALGRLAFDHKTRKPAFGVSAAIGVLLVMLATGVKAADS